MRFSDYIVYVDESGDHSLTSIHAGYPIFVLALCIFHKEEYANVTCIIIAKKDLMLITYP